MKLQFSITHKKMLVDVHTLYTPVKLDLMLHIGQKAHEPDITLHTLRYKVNKNVTLESLSL